MLGDLAVMYMINLIYLVYICTYINTPNLRVHGLPFFVQEGESMAAVKGAPREQ